MTPHPEDLPIGDAGVVAIYRQEPDGDVMGATIVEYERGLKRYARVWDAKPTKVEWGWVLHESAVRIHPAEPGTADLRDLAERLTGAAAALDALVPAYSDPAEQARLRGKVEGVRLALSYVEEALR